MYQTGKFNKKCDWLNVSVDDWTLNISADMNYGEERTFRINVEATLAILTARRKS